MTGATALIIGSGLIGTSTGLALRAAGWRVWLADDDADAVAAAVAMGAGEARQEGDVDPAIVVVAVPPRHVVDVAGGALQQFPAATVTDVASVKAPIVDGLVTHQGSSAARFVGGHPMAGREVSGPGGAMPELFRDRPWVITPQANTDPERVAAVVDLVAAVGAIPIELSPEEHDRAVALTSHAPQVLASLLAGRLSDADDEQVLVSGQGLRDTIRIASSDPELWSEILTANAGPVVAELRCLAADLQRLVADLQAGGEQGREAAYSTVQAGRRGAARLPGKHGSSAARYRTVRVAVPDEPGSLAALFAVAAEAGVNLEDVRIEHALGRPTGLVELSVAPDHAEELVRALGAADWSLRA
jgi:prephenate dehydrogenase